MKTLQHKIDFVTNGIWLALAESYPKLIRFDAPRIVLCNRLTRTAGKCYQEENRIHLGNKFFLNNHSAMMLEILPHEIAHQADFNLFGLSEKNCGHGKNWCKIMVKLGLPANKYHALTI
jgi:predicted SprT family Zn-dependent metalloprotease